MIMILQEVNEPSDVGYKGMYHVNKQGQLVAYRQLGGSLKIFRKPLKMFSKSRRKFEKIGEYYE